MLALWLATYCARIPVTPLINAAREGDTVRIRSLVAGGANPNMRGGVNGWTPIEHAVHKNQMASVRALLDAGADPNAANPNGVTPLIMASGYGYTPIVQLLLKRGANPRLTDSEGQNALDAAMSGTNDIDRFTLHDCQRATLDALRREVPDLSPRREQITDWTKRCR
jgi:ankyrin repeat protein